MKKHCIDQIKSVLIIKTSSLGDIVHSFPLLHAIKSVYPDAKIDWVVEKTAETLVSSHPLVDQVITIDSKRWKRNLFSCFSKVKEEWKLFYRSLRTQTYDLVIDLQGNCKSGLVTFLTKSQVKLGYSLSSAREWPNVLSTNCRYPVDIKKNIRSQYMSLLEKYLNKDLKSYIGSHSSLCVLAEEKEEQERFFESYSLNEKKPLVLVFPFAKRKTKELPLNLLSAFLIKIQNAQNVNFLIGWGSQEEKRDAEELSRQINNNVHVLPIAYSYGILQEIMNEVSLVIGMDSFPIHFCGYFCETPTYSFFGPTSSTVYLPIGDHKHFQGKCPYIKSFDKTCPNIRSCKTYPCLQDIDLEKALGDINHMFSL